MRLPSTHSEASATAQGPHDRGGPGNQATAVGVDALLSNEWAGGNINVGGKEYEHWKF